MAGRFAWIMAGGAAILAGMAFQGDLFDGDGDGDKRPSVTIQHDGDRKDGDVESRVERIVEEKIANAPVVDGDGEPIEVSRVVREELASAVTEKIKAEAALALLTMKSEPSADNVAAAEARVTAADARVDAIEARLDAAKDARDSVDAAERERIRAEVRDAVRDAVKN